MGPLRPPRGLILDLLIPLSDTGSIDGDALGRHLAQVLPHIQAVLLAGPRGGEGTHLDLSFREELLEKALGFVQGKIPVWMWITAPSADETRRNLRSLQEKVHRLHYSGSIFWVDMPLIYHSNRNLPRFYAELTSEADFPILLHNDPDWIRALGHPLKRNHIRTAVLKELCRIDMLAGLIFSGPLERANAYQKAVRGGTAFPVYDGDEAQFLDSPSLSGVVSVGANIAPVAWQKITSSSLHLDGDQGVFQDDLSQIWNLGRYVRNLKNMYDPMTVPVLKAVLSEKGIFSTDRCIQNHGETTAAKTLLKTVTAEGP